MKLKILSIHNEGDHTKEHVLMQAQEDCDIGVYAIADSTYTDEDKISNKLRNFYWFPDTSVSKGDYVSLWTGKGNSVKAETKSGAPVHRFYWGLDKAVWNDTGDCAVLLQIDPIQFFRV